MSENETSPFDYALFLDESGESIWDELRFELMWREYGGQGLGMSFTEIGELDWMQVRFFIDRMREQKKKEAAALKGGRGMPML